MSRLKALRKSKRPTQLQMQMFTGIDQSDYSKIESEKRYYTFEQCKRIAIALTTSMDYLAGLTNEKNHTLAIRINNYGCAVKATNQSK